MYYFGLLGSVSLGFTFASEGFGLEGVSCSLLVVIVDSLEGRMMVFEVWVSAGTISWVLLVVVDGGVFRVETFEVWVIEFSRTVAGDSVKFSEFNEFSTGSFNVVGCLGKISSFAEGREAISVIAATVVSLL